MGCKGLLPKAYLYKGLGRSMKLRACTFGLYLICSLSSSLSFYSYPTILYYVQWLGAAEFISAEPTQPLNTPPYYK
jgi:hypothetical protein